VCGVANIKIKVHSNEGGFDDEDDEERKNVNFRLDITVCLGSRGTHPSNGIGA
jgi:hypothetical protein